MNFETCLRDCSVEHLQNKKLAEKFAREIEDIWGYAKRLRFVREVIRASFPAPRVISVLDIGCGNGSQLAIPLARDPGLRMTGIDPDAASIEHGKRLARSSTSLNFICASIEDLPDDNRFDVIILSEVLEHLDQPDEMLRYAKRLLQNNGILIVTVPNGYGEFEIDSWFFRALRLQRVVDRFAPKNEVLAGTDNSDSGHVQFFTRSRLTKLFQQTGLVTIREGAGSLLAGPVAGHFVSRSRRLVEWNARITDRLPFVLASGWYFALRLKNPIEPAGDTR
jgi:2-polyprenyl-3-methyl-5-hydroxy-6-metoxy-1,4-benzoquinol methylase